MTIFCIAYTKAGVSGPPRILITNQANGVEAALYALRVLQVKLPLDIPKPFSLKQVLALAEDCEISMNVVMLKQGIDCPLPMTKAQIEAASYLLESIDSKQKDCYMQSSKPDDSLSELHEAFLAGTLVSRVKNF